MRSQSLSLTAGMLAAFAAVGAAQQAPAPGAPSPDPRVGLRAGIANAAQAAWNLKLVTNVPKPAAVSDDTNPNDFGYMNSDIGFTGHYLVQGNFHGLQVWDIAKPATPALVTIFLCPEFQNDVSVYHNLLFASGEDFNGRLDCGTQGVQDTVSKERMRGIRIFDISDIAHPRQITAVQTCRGSHTHTVVTSPTDTADVYIYVSGSSPVRSPNELAGCSALTPDKDPNSELFKIEVIQVPLAHPELAHVVSKPAILADLTAPTSHGEAPEDIAANAARVADWKAKGGLTAKVHGMEVMLGPGFMRNQLDSIVKARHGTGAPTAADSTLLRDSAQVIVDRIVNPPAGSGPPPGPVQCHDITVYPAIGLAGGACAGYGLLLDITDPANPKRIASVSDSNFSYWHSATFNNDGTKVLFSDEWGGGLAPKCRATDKMQWGADALFAIGRDKALSFESYYKMPAAQTSMENCVAHNGSLIPVPGRDIMVQGWYQGGISVFDWTDAAHPKEIAFFDRGPMDSTKLIGAGSWSAYWYNGMIYSSEIGRGLDVLELTPNALLSQNEIDAAQSVWVPYLNVQDQQKIVWPASFALARAYLDQLERDHGWTPAMIASTRAGLSKAEKQSGTARKTTLSRLATELHAAAAKAGDQAKVHKLAYAVGDLANKK
ncbi:MAG TPA: hypothetical protein VI160_06620 [Gemmatimonadales bacterium]